MRLFRRLLLIATTSLFRLTLVFGVTIVALLLVVGKADHIKNTLIRTNTYHQFVPAIIQAQSTNGQNAGLIPLSDHGVQAIINDAFSPDVIQRSSETLINSTYEWLNGTTPDLRFKIDLTQNRALLSENLSIYAFNRLAAQPLCKTIPAIIDPFTTTCLPPDFSISAERAEFSQQVNNLLPKTVFTQDDLPKLANGKSFTQSYPYAPKLYRVFILSPYILGALIVVLVSVILWECRTTRRGVKLLGSITLSSGIALVITPILYEIVYPHISSSLNLQSTNTGVNPLINNVVNDLSHSFYTYLIIGSIIVINAGFTMLLLERLTRPSGYHDLVEKTGLSSSDPIRKRRTSSAGLLAKAIPLQSSESELKSKSGRRYRSYRKLHDKEL